MPRRTLLAAVVVGLAGWLLAAAPLAFATTPLALAAQQKPGPIVHFHGDGPVPLVCTSTPDRSSVQVDRGQWLNVVNQTGVAATVIVGDHRLPVPDGRGRSLKLRPGHYLVMMQPRCLVGTGGGRPVAVEVTNDPSTNADPSTGPSRAADQPGSPDTVVTEPVRAEPSELLEADLYSPPGTGQLPKVSILGLIAAICVFGVTASIIRAILAQRATTAVARHRSIS